MSPRNLPIASLAFGLLLPLAAASPRAQDAPPKPRWTESIETSDGRRIPGRIEGDAISGFRFAPADGSPPRPLVELSAVHGDPPADPADPSAPPFQALLGAQGRVSGRLESLDADEIRFLDGPGLRALRMQRSGVRAIVQRPGETQILAEGFQSIDSDRWSARGAPRIVTDPVREGSGSLALPAGSTELTAMLPEPVATGRLELAYYDSAERKEGRRWLVELVFRAPQGNETVQAVLGWEEPSLAVRSSGDGPTLAVQHLERTEGWHRLAVRFGPDDMDLTVDGDELAHGDGPAGALVAIRLATESDRRAPEAPMLAAFVDDLRLVRFVQPSGPFEVDPTQDDARLVSGDQVFGSVLNADAELVQMQADGRRIRIPWSQVAGIHFRGAPAPSPWVEGLWIRAAWRTHATADPRELDVLEGALVEATPEALAVETPYLGRVLLPRDALVHIQVIGPRRRMILDPSSHHLGNNVVPELDPPQPGGGTLEIPFELPEVPPGTISLAVDVIGLIGIAGNPDYSERVRKGELCTHVALNGQGFGCLNEHLETPNEEPIRLTLPIPPGLLRAGRNVLRFEQVGTAEDPRLLDNVGLLVVALENQATHPRPPSPRAAGDRP